MRSTAPPAPAAASRRRPSSTGALSAGSAIAVHCPFLPAPSRPLPRRPSPSHSAASRPPPCAPPHRQPPPPHPAAALPPPARCPPHRPRPSPSTVPFVLRHRAPCAFVLRRRTPPPPVRHRRAPPPRQPPPSHTGRPSRPPPSRSGIPSSTAIATRRPSSSAIAAPSRRPGIAPHGSSSSAIQPRRSSSSAIEHWRRLVSTVAAPGPRHPPSQPIAPSFSADTAAAPSFFAIAARDPFVHPVTPAGVLRCLPLAAGRSFALAAPSSPAVAARGPVVRPVTPAASASSAVSRSPPFGPPRSPPLGPLRSRPAAPRSFADAAFSVLGRHGSPPRTLCRAAAVPLVFRHRAPATLGLLRSRPRRHTPPVALRHPPPREPSPPQPFPILPAFPSLSVRSLLRPPPSARRRSVPAFRRPPAFPPQRRPDPAHPPPPAPARTLPPPGAPGRLRPQTAGIPRAGLLG